MAGFYTKCDSWKGKTVSLQTRVAKRPLQLIRSGDAEGFHLAIQVAAFEAESRRGLGHVPAVFLELAQDELAFVSAAGFMKR